MTISDQLKRLLILLSDNKYHSGTELGAALGLTRSGIWKLIKQMTPLGLTVESVTNKGYRLTRPLELLDKSAIDQQLDHLFILDDIPSTNDYLMSCAKEYPATAVACLAEQQTAGRGRLGREWVSPFAANIYLSLLWHFECGIAELAGLNIVAGVSAADAINAISNIPDLKLKWPNDLYYQDKKLGGILIDLQGEHNGKTSAVIGIGINVCMPPESARSIDQPWIDLQQATGNTVSRNKLAASLINQLVINLTQFTQTGLHAFIDRWNQLDYLKGNTITIQSGNTTVKGIARGIDQHGYLLLESGSQLRTIASGDASIVKAS